MDVAEPALGADRSRMMRLLFVGGLRTVAVGLAIGLRLALGLGRLAQRGVSM